MVDPGQILQIPMADQLGGAVDWVNRFMSGGIVVTQENIFAAFAVGGSLIILGISVWGVLNEISRSRIYSQKRR